MKNTDLKDPFEPKCGPGAAPLWFGHHGVRVPWTLECLRSAALHVWVTLFELSVLLLSVLSSAKTPRFAQLPI